MIDAELRALLLATFAREAAGRLRAMQAALDTREVRPPAVRDALREAHSLKGAARAAELWIVERIAHEIEELLVSLVASRPADGARLPAETVAAVRGALLALTAACDAATGTPATGPSPGVAEVTAFRQVFEDFGRQVAGLSRSTGKPVELLVEGDAVTADRAVLDALRVPLQQLVHNAVDHGVEPPEVRRALGKPARGTVTLRARADADHVRVEVADDGGGVDLARVRATAAERGLCTPAEAAAMDDDTALGLISRFGFSTRREVTALSGRGLGLDVVREQIERLGGTVEVRSHAGRGSVVTLVMPRSGRDGPPIVLGIGAPDRAARAASRLPVALTT